MKKRPNIVLITVDSLRADYIGYQNSKELNTSFLDNLSKESLVYTHAIAPGIPTFFSFPSVMTGKIPFSYGYKLGIDASAENKTIAQVLKENGYTTLAVLADDPTLYKQYNYNRGFDVYEDGQERRMPSTFFLINILWMIRERIPSKIVDILEYIRAVFNVLVNTPDVHILGEDLNEKIKKVLVEHSTTPFFLWVHYQDPHYPYQGGLKKYFFTKDNRIIRILKKIMLYKELAVSSRTMKIRNNDLLAIFKEAYRSGIKYVDSVIEGLYTYVSERYSNTIFIITADHGEAFMEHGLYSHEPYSLYHELIGIPLLIHLPSKNGKIVSDVVSTMSLAKTICSFADIKNHNFGGTDISHEERDVIENHVSKILFECRSPTIRFQIFDSETEIRGFNELVSYTTSRYKYIAEVGGKLEELYDLKIDPQEQKNLIGKVPQSILVGFRKKIKQILPMKIS